MKVIILVKGVQRQLGFASLLSAQRYEDLKRSAKGNKQ
jgi:hypothetical protein